MTCLTIRVALFLDWLEDARQREVAEPHAMTLSTVDSEGVPDARVLVLKDVGANGWAFASTRTSAKAIQLEASSQNTDAAKCGLQINWASKKIVAAKIAEKYPKSTFVPKQRVGIDTSKLSAARTGIRGSNDLVWVGNAANNAAKLAALDPRYTTYITADVYSRLSETSKLGGDPKRNRGLERWWPDPLDRRLPGSAGPGPGARHSGARRAGPRARGSAGLSAAAQPRREAGRAPVAAHTSRHFCASVAAVSCALSPLGLGSAHRAPVRPSGHGLRPGLIGHRLHPEHRTGTVEGLTECGNAHHRGAPDQAPTARAQLRAGQLGRARRGPSHEVGDPDPALGQQALVVRAQPPRGIDGAGGGCRPQRARARSGCPGARRGR